MRKLYYVANARMPNEKAHGIQIAKMCEAFVAHGIDLTLIVPRRQTQKQSLKDFYGLSHDVPRVLVPTLDLYRAGPLGFALGSFFFIVFVECLLWYKKMRGERFTVYTIDMDSFSYAPLPLVGKTFTEMHTPKTPSWVQRFFFVRATGVVATNGLIRQRLIDDYHLPETKVISAPNGVDLSSFALEVTRREAREKLSLPQDTKIVLYVGRFYQWKGLDIVLPACEKLPPGVQCYIVGGTKESFMQVTGATAIPHNLVFMGERPVGEIPLWLRASDALLLLGTNKNEDSSRYTSPMKLFEYMASKTPIVASATPAVTDVLSPSEAYLFEPDDADSLAQAVADALVGSDTPERAAHAQAKVRTLTWEMRARRIITFMQSRYPV